MIKKSLDTSSAKYSKELNEASAVNEVKLLMEGDAIEDLHLIQNAFPESANTKLINVNGERERIKKLSKDHRGSVYTSAEIKSLCMKYRLRFLPSTLFKGSVPVELVHEIKRLSNDQSRLKYLSGDNSTGYERNLYIIAPASLFKIESVSKQKEADLREMKRLREMDPACFIKLEDDKYLFVKEWGNSFSFGRRVLGELTAKAKTLNKLFFFGWVTFLIVMFNVLAAMPDAVVKVGEESHRATGWFFPFWAVFIASVVIAIAWVVEDSFMFKSIKNSGWWKVDENYSTEKNWDKSNFRKTRDSDRW